MNNAATEPSHYFDVTTIPGGGSALAGIPPLAQGELVHRALHVIRENPGAAPGDALRLAHQMWGAIRGLEYDADGHTFEFAMARLEIPSPIYRLELLLRLLLDAGTLEDSLVRARAGIDEQLRALRAEREEAESK